MNEIKAYNETNNSFKKKIIFHVGTGAGFYSEIGGMLQAMCYCHTHKIKFILYADDANFAAGGGWGEFFLPFCPQNHDRLNHEFNRRDKPKGIIDRYNMGQALLKIRNGVDYLTSDIFGEACLSRYLPNPTHVKWEYFGIDGDINREFVKLRGVALRYNKPTFWAIKENIRKLNLPACYYSVQLRGGDKNLEVINPINIDCIVNRMKQSGEKIEDLFIFTDDFQYVKAIKERCPKWNIYTLTKEHEHGYVNEGFNRTSRELRHREMIKLFAMTEICLNSKLHFGCAVTCVNNYIKNIKGQDEYMDIWTEEDAGIRSQVIQTIKDTY